MKDVRESKGKEESSNCVIIGDIKKSRELDNWEQIFGQLKRTLAEVEAKAENCQRAIQSFEEALRVYRMEKLSELCQLVERNLRILSEFCKSDEIVKPYSSKSVSA